MSHEITHTNGRNEIAFVGATPWHGLGQQLPADASVDEWKVAAGMDWKIGREPVRFAITKPDGERILRAVNDKHVLFRDDSYAPLGVVSDSYKTVQPGEVLEFFRDLVELNGFKLDVAGTLFGGKRFWAIARIGADAEIVNRDRIGGHLLLSTSADGSLATEARFTTVRVVCNNTLSMARHAKADFRLTHRSRFDSAACKRALGVGADQFAATVDEMKALSHITLDRTMRESFVIQTLADGALSTVPDGKAIDKIRDSAAYREIMALFTTGRGAMMDGVRGTAWGALNAITEYVDHKARARSNDNRFASSQFGPGADLKDRARDLLANLI